MGEQIADLGPSAVEIAEQGDSRRAAWAMLATLPGPEAAVFRLRFGLDDGEPWTVSRIADHLRSAGLSSEGGSGRGWSGCGVCVAWGRSGRRDSKAPVRAGHHLGDHDPRAYRRVVGCPSRGGSGWKRVDGRQGTLLDACRVTGRERDASGAG